MDVYVRKALPVPPLPSSALRDTVLVEEEVKLRVTVALPVGEVEVLEVEEGVVVGELLVVVEPVVEPVRVLDTDELKVVVELVDAVGVDVDEPEVVPEVVEVAVEEVVPEEVEVAVEEEVEVSLREDTCEHKRRKRVKTREKRLIKSTPNYK